MSDREALLHLCHQLGEPERDLVLVSEGNASVRLGNGQMLIKASGCSMEAMTDADLLVVDRGVVVSLLDDQESTDERTAELYRQAVVGNSTTVRMPSVESILHAVIYAETDAVAIAHTHPVAVNSILCSVAPELLVAGAMFPDQIVVLGSRQLLIPYTDPGVPLARAVQTHIREFASTHGSTPRVIYLVNHGLFVLAASPTEAMQITSMAVKTARVLLGTLAAGGPAFLTDEHVARIEGRPDEQYRRALLTQGQERA